MNRLWELQNAAEQTVRRTARAALRDQHAVVDAGNIMIVRDAVHDAWNGGYERALLEVTDAFALALQDDEGFDIDTFTAVLEDMNRGRHERDDSKMKP